jgi:hypothetical protein
MSPMLKSVKSIFLSVILLSTSRIVNAQAIDTVYAGKILPNAALIKPAHNRYMMLVSAKNVYRTIKYLDRETRLEGENLIVIQKLMNGAYTNTDSVIVNRNTLLPVESYSDINTSKDSFVYKNGRVTGTMLSREGSNKGTITRADTAFAKPLFNGLIYAETFQGISYVKNHPFVIAEYVPGHQTKFTKVEYVKNEALNFLGKQIDAKVIKAHTNGGDIYYWLNAGNQELIKIEAKFPGFDYYLLRTV